MLMRATSLMMAFALFVAPQILNSQSIVSLYAECGSQPVPIIEEEVLKHACEVRSEVCPLASEGHVKILLHQYEESMLDHPAMEVPHQPPKGA
ncbi:MAG: hypothetical protein IPG92_16975 [Flavobacteriales bacterium]|nr:hypothetical protein [Flavobacteriales bacterium]MBP7407156.1 hypothetical protein [Flavobacteriales bacterium]